MDSEPQTTHLHLLLVDDNPRYLAELEEWLRNFGYHRLTLARSEAEARQLLQQVFDVIVVDMKLEQEESGLAIIEEIKRHTNKVLFLFDRDVRDGNLPNKGQDFENLYIRRVDDYSSDKKGIESLLSETLLEEGVAKGFVTKTIVQTITATGSESRYRYQVINKTGLCNWVCGERKNNPADFAGFQKTIDIIRALSAR